MESINDSDLMGKIRDGNRQAFAQVIDRYRDSLVNYLSRLCGSSAKAEDLAQETFLRLYEKSANYNEIGKLTGYLYRIATNLAMSWHRREKRRRILSRIFIQSELGGVPCNPHYQLIAKETHQKIQEALGKIPFSYRIPLVLHEIQNLPYQEIGKILGVKEGTVKSRISRGRNLLRKILSAYYHGGLR